METQTYGIRCAPSCRTDAKIGSSFMQRFRAQFGKPTGFWGQIAGWIMAHRPSNRERNAWAVSLLNIQPSDRVLEIGCGPGVGITKMRDLVINGQIVGIDHSEVMLAQASKRNAAAIYEGTVELFLASVLALPNFYLPFDRIISVNTIQYWEDATAVLRTLRGLMNPGGRIAIAFQPRFQGATDEDAQQSGRAIVEHLEEAGFSEVRLETKQMKPVHVTCAVGVNAERPEGGHRRE